MRRTAVALIDEPRCIGCTRCIETCPVDAVSGAQGLMHCVIAAWCTGCERCLPACPVDCIAMVPAPGPWTRADGDAAGARARRRKKRLRYARRTTAAERRAILAAALKRGQAR